MAAFTFSAKYDNFRLLSEGRAMFEKNLEFIDNPALVRRLSKLSLDKTREGISYCVTPSDDFILLKNDEPSDDLNNPREAIRSILHKTIKKEMKSNDIIITFGLGLGYILDEVFNTYPSRIFVYEPDLNLLHFVLNNIDISQHLASGRVYMTNDMDELINKLGMSFLTNDRVEIVYLKNYAVLKSRELLLLSQKVYDTCKSKMVDINTASKFSKGWLVHTIRNIAAINDGEMYKLSDLEGKFRGSVALVAGAGPSLNDDIENIKANRDKFIIFCVNKALRYMLHNGIIPDFVVCLDTSKMDDTFEGIENDLQNIDCIMDIRTNSQITKYGFNKIFWNFSETDTITNKIGEFNNDLILYKTGGSASIFAIVAAIKMGFGKIVLTGIDLAFKDDFLYSSGETIKRISPNVIEVNFLRKNLVRVKSVTGKDVYTREDYEVFIHHIEDILKETGYKEIYNLSSFGAYIQGVNNITFDNLNLEDNGNNFSGESLKPFKLELERFIQDEFNYINDVISYLSKGIFSVALVSAITKSVFLFQIMQPDILKVLQQNFAPALAEDFIEKTKESIRLTVNTLQENKLI